MSYSKR